MLWEMLAAWVGLPIVAVLVSLGLALLVERLTGCSLGALRVPVGLCAAICLTLAVYWVDGPAPIAVATIAAGGALGLIMARAQLIGWRPGWFTVAWVVAYGLHLAPVILSGEAAWAGYNFVNDTATQMVLTEYLVSEGVVTPDGPQLTTAAEYVRVYLSGAYPVGTHALLGTFDKLIPGPLPALYQPYIAVLAASATLALAQLARRAGLPVAAAAAAGVAAVAANLFYQYALQGNVKEMAFFMALATAAAVGRELIGAERPLAYSLPAAIAFAAAFNVYSVAAAAYLIALGVALGGAALWRRGRDPSVVSLLVAGLALLVGALVLAVPGLAGAITFNAVASGTFSGATREADLGQLLRPLDLAQVSGVWLTGDYRLPVPSGRELISAGLCLVVGALALTGLVGAVRRREPAGLLLLVPTLLAAAYLLPRLSPYADGKVFALASPVVVLVAAIGIWSVSRFAPAAAVVLAAIAAGGVLWSDAFAYHVVRIAPTDRLNALEDVGKRLEGAPGLVMVNEPEEFAKVYQGGASFNTATEPYTPRQVQLRTPESSTLRYFDLDQHVSDYVQQFPTIVKRRSPDASRPPANYRLTYANGWYEVWRRQAEPKVIEHLPLQGVHRVAVRPRCSDVLAMAKRAGPGHELVAARSPDLVTLDTSRATRSFAWTPHPWQPGMVVTPTPGRARKAVRVEQAGRYRAWVAGSFGRPIKVRVDDRVVGEAEGVNNLGQWLPGGEVSLQRGRHELVLERGGGGVDPGDGFEGELGPLVLEPVRGRTTLHKVRPQNARRLCGQAWDWIERVQA